MTRRSGPLSASGLAVLAVLHVLPFATRPRLIGGDEPHYALMAHSIAVDGDFDLGDDYGEVERGSNAAGKSRAGSTLDAHLVDRGGRAVFAHPLGLPLLAAPLLLVVHAIEPRAPPDVPLGILGLTFTFCALLMGRDLLRPLAGERAASVAAFSVYFATPLWYYSRTFFTEPYVWSFAVLSWWLFRRQHWLAGGTALAATLALKETSLLIVLPVLLSIWAGLGFARFAKAAVGTVAFAIAFLGKNLYLWNEAFVTFQPFHRGSFVDGARGLLLSPEHGVLVFAPLLALVPLAWVGRQQDATNWRMYAAVAVSIFAGYFVITAFWVDWGGGSSFGPRLLVPGIAGMALPLTLAWRWLVTRGRWIWVWAVLAIGGFVIQWCAAIEPRAALWSPAAWSLVREHPLGALAGVCLGASVWAGLVKSGWLRAMERDAVAAS